MRKVGLMILLAGIVLGYGNPGLARETGSGPQDRVGAGKDKKHSERALGSASQKRNENSNAQWSSGATRGQDRAALRHQGRSQARNDGSQARGLNKEQGGNARSSGRGQTGKSNQRRNTF